MLFSDLARRPFASFACLQSQLAPPPDAEPLSMRFEAREAFLLRLTLDGWIVKEDSVRMSDRISDR